MKFVVNQYLVFKNSVAKINYITNDGPSSLVTLRKITFGKDYDYQSDILLKNLYKMHREGKVKTVNPITIMKMIKKIHEQKKLCKQIDTVIAK